MFVDFENVQPKDLSLLSHGAFRIKVFLGVNQPKVPTEIVQALQPFGKDAEYIRIEGSGRNALDFHIAWYLGRLATENPGCYFHVISRDTGFDPLIKHLKALGIACGRSVSIASVPGVQISNAKPRPEKVVTVIKNLTGRASRPGTLRTLCGTINDLFRGQLAVGEVDGLIDELKARQVIKVSDDGKLHYQLHVAAGKSQLTTCDQKARIDLTTANTRATAIRSAA